MDRTRVRVAIPMLGLLMAMASIMGGIRLWRVPEVDAQGGTDLQNPFEGDSAAIQQGLELYNERCSFCHGTRGRGAKGPCLTCGHFLYRGGSNAQLFATISGGIPGGQMGAFAASLSGGDIWRIIAFLRDETKKRNAEAAPEQGSEPSASSTSRAQTPVPSSPADIPPNPGGADTPQAATPAPPVDLNDAAVIQAGRDLFHVTCSHYCHGPGAKGGGARGPSLRHRDFDNAYLFQRISNGQPPMPAFKDVYTPEQIWKLIAYVQSLKTAKD